MAKVRPSAETVLGPDRHSPIRNAFIRRSTHVIERLAERADVATLVEAMAAPTDFGTLTRILADVGSIRTAVAELDPEALDLADEIAHREELVQLAGGMLSAEEAGQLLHIGRQAVDKRRRNKTLLAIRQAGDWLYPRAQFHQHEVIPGLTEIVKGFAASGPWVTLEFIVTGDTTLDGLTPGEALLRGGELYERVITLVRGQEVGEGFA
jgi:hypothetical protein